MGIVVRQSVKSFIINNLGVVLGYVLFLYIYPKILTADELGLIATIEDMAWILMAFCTFGIQPIMFKFYPHFKDENNYDNGFLFLSTIIPVVGVSLLLMLYFLLKSTLIRYFPSLNIFIEVDRPILSLVVILSLFLVFEIYSRILLRIVVPTLIKEIIRKLIVIAIAVGYFLGYYSFSTFLALFVANYAISLVLLIIYVYFLDGGLKSMNYAHFNASKALMHSIFSYGIIVFLGSFGSQIVTRVDTVMITGMLSTEFSGIYRIAIKLAVFIQAPQLIISQIITPIISEAYKEQDMQQIDYIYKSTATNQLLAGTFLFLLILINLPELFFIMPNGHIYAACAIPFIILSTGKLFDMFTATNHEILIISNHYKFSLQLTIILAVLTVSLNLIFIERFQLIGVAFASAISIFLINFFRTYYVYRKMRIHPFSIQFYKALTLFGLILLANYIFGKYISYNQWIETKNLKNVFYAIGIVGIKSIFLTVIFSVAVLKFNISNEINSVYLKALEFIKAKR